NAVMESTIGLFKTEVIDNERRTWTSWRQVEAAVASWVTWYNHERLHSSIGDVPPAEYEQTYHGLTHAADTTVAASPTPPKNSGRGRPDRLDVRAVGCAPLEFLRLAPTRRNPERLRRPAPGAQGTHPGNLRRP